jgi:uncharacterized protein (DUF58 family)
MHPKQLRDIDLSSLREFESLELFSKQVVEGFITGLHKSPYHGFSVEFAEHRLYNKGESTRHIDWKIYGRTDKLFVKKYEEETNLRCQIVIDNSSSMHYPDPQRNKLQFSVVCAASIIHLLKKQRDAAGLSVFSDHIEKFLQPRLNNVHMKLLFQELYTLMVADTKNKKTSTAGVLHQIAESIHKRSLVVIFSDMMDNTTSQDEIFESLQHLKYNKHEVILFHVVDKAKELEFDFENRPYLFIDIETGEEVKVHPHEVKEHYLKHISEYRKQLMLKCSQYKIDYYEADINRDFRQVLLPFLLKRSRLY